MNHHKINSLLIDLNFESRQLGDEFQQQAAAYVKNRLLPVAERLFDLQANSDNVISIDKLEIDLGEIHQQDFLSQLEHNFEQVLTQKLHELIPESPACISSSDKRAGSDQSVQALDNNLHPLGRYRQSDQTAVNIMSHRDVLLQQLGFYLLHGTMQWNFSPSMLNTKQQASNLSNTANLSSNWLAQLLTPHLDWLLAFIEQNLSQSKNIIRRLFYQAPELLNKVADKLPRQQQIILIDLLGQEDNATQRQVLKDFNDSHWQQIIVRGLVSGSAKSLLPIWPKLLTSYENILINILRVYGQQVSFRTAIVNDFTSQMLLDVIVLLEPLEYPFIHQLLKQEKLFHITQAQPLAQHRATNDYLKKQSNEREANFEKNQASSQIQKQLCQFTFD